MRAMGRFLRPLVRYFYMRSAQLRGQFPAHDRATGHVVVPIRNPRVGENVGRIEFENLTLTLELAHVVDDDGAFFREVAVAARPGRASISQSLTGQDGSLNQHLSWVASVRA